MNSASQPAVSYLRNCCFCPSLAQLCHALPLAQTFVVTSTFSLPSRKRSITAALCSTIISPLSNATWWPSFESSAASQPAVFRVWNTKWGPSLGGSFNAVKQEQTSLGSAGSSTAVQFLYHKRKQLLSAVPTPSPLQTVLPALRSEIGKCASTTAGTLL